MLESHFQGAKLCFMPLLSDNGPEMTSKAMFLSSERSGVRLHFIRPGKPMENAFVESLNGKFRDTCLNEHWFMDIMEARRRIETWRVHYNEERPHSSLDRLPPAVFARAMRDLKPVKSGIEYNDGGSPCG